MTRYQARHYRDIAAILAALRHETDDTIILDVLIERFAELFAVDNPRFNIARFRAACVD
jgi:hypothetical protein